MTARWLSLLVVIAPVLGAQTLPSAQQITSNNAINYVWSNRTSSTSGGQIQFASAPADDTIYLYNGSSIVTVQATIPGQTINPTVTMLGSGATSGVVGGWRRDDGVGWVSVNGGTPQTENLNPEHLSINGGCVFMTLQTNDNALGNQAYQINPADGTRTRIGTDGATANHGAFRVYNIGCSKLGIGWLDDNNLNDIKYWNGSTLTTVDTNTTEYDFSFASGRMVYVRVVNGVQQVFLVDTNVSLTPVQLTSETDNTVLLKRPQTDGRHVAWYRVDGGGNAQIVLNGGIVFPTGPLGAIDATAWPFQLNRGQLLWTNSSTAPRTFFYDDGTRTYPIDPSPATSISATPNGGPWLTDGTIAFLGPTATSAANNQVFRITGTTPADSSQPSPPMIVTATPGIGGFGPQVTLNWDRVLGATLYNVYYAPAPGVTKANYASLGGYRTSASPGSAFPVDPGTWSFCVTTIDAGGEGPCSRTATATVIGHMTWHSVGGLGTTTFYSAAADPSNASLAYAGADGSVYKSTDGGINWTSSLTHATSGGTRTAALAVGSSGVFANMMSEATIWRSVDNGGSWTEVLSNATGFGELNGSIAIDPLTPATIYAGDFKLPGYAFATDSLVIKSTDGGSNWNFTAQGQNGASDDLHAYTIAIDPVTPAKIFAGGTGTPPLAKSTNGTTSWTDLSLPDTNTGGVYSIAIDPSNTNVVYATTRDLGVYKSIDGGVTWTATNSGLSGASTGSGTGFNSILVDPRDSNFIHLGAGNGYWYSLDAAKTWNAANSGFGGSPAYIYSLAMTPSHRLIAATTSGLFLLSFAPPIASSVSPNACNTAGGANVTISGIGFQSGATVTFGGAPATNVVVVNAMTITATTPPHAAGMVGVVVTNPDFASSDGGSVLQFTYTATPSIPENVVAAAQSTTSVSVTWNAVSSATSYQVFRNDGAGFGSAIAAGTNSYTDSGLTPATSHLYKVRAVNASGASADSAVDIATTVIFANDPLVAGSTVIKAVHLSDLRTAVNAVRHLAGKGDYPFTDTAGGGLLIKAVHITELRAALDEARTALNMTTGGYTDATLGGIPVKAVHFQELRNRVK